MVPPPLKKIRKENKKWKEKTFQKLKQQQQGAGGTKWVWPLKAHLSGRPADSSGTGVGDGMGELYWPRPAWRLPVEVEGQAPVALPLCLPFVSDTRKVPMLPKQHQIARL